MHELPSIAGRKQRPSPPHRCAPPRRLRRPGCVLLIILCCALAPRARALELPPAAAPPPATVPAPATADGVVRVTAVVTDRRGQLLRNLKPSDFELLVDGQPHALDGAEYTAVAPTAPRTIAFLLDEFHTAAADSAAVREGLLRFIDARFRPGDLAVVVKPLDPLSAIKTTGDRETIRQAISSFEGRKGDYTPRTPFERNYMAQAPAAVEWARAQIVTSALRAIGVTLSHQAQGQPAIVLVSDGFARMRASRDVPGNLQSAVRVANRADAPVYAFAPSLKPPVEDGQTPPDGALLALRMLAADTGGALFTGAGEFDAGFARMTRDLEAHYVLTYRARHGSDGRFHALRVGVKRPDAQVQARAGYVAPMSAAMRTALSPAPSAPMRVLRRSALIQSWSGVSPAEPGRMTVMLTWMPSISTTSPRPRASSVVITASAPDGTVLFDGSVGPAGQPPSTGVPNHASFDAPMGPVRVDMKILDAKGVVLDTDARDVAAPNRRADSATIFAPAVLRANSARQFRELAADPNAAPVPIRDFRRTDRLLIRVVAVDAAGAAVAPSGTLLNRQRQQMRTLAPIEDAGGSATTQFDLALAGLAPGEYTVRLTVPSPGGAISEHITFRVQG